MTTMNFVETIPVRGEFQIIITENGVATELPVANNMIVYAGRTAVAAGLLNKSHAYIDHIAFGRMSASEVVTPEMVALPNEVPTVPADYKMTILDGSAAKPPRIQYVITIPETGLNNKTFNCAALIMNDGKPFAIKKFGDITKTDAMGLAITWTIYV